MRVIGDVLTAIAQVGDPRFARVLAIGLGLTLALLAAAYGVVLVGVDWLVPETLTLPFVGEVGWIDEVLSGASVLAMLVLSIFLMVPVTSAFTSLFLEDVTDAVEARHYPHLAPGPRLGILEGLVDSLRFMGLLIVANLAAFAGYLLLPPAAPLIFLAVNGYLLSREYFELIARRRHTRDEARRLRRRHAVQVWLAGLLMALPLLVPILNLIVPILGAATFTHLYHRLPPLPARDPSGRTSPGRGR